MNNYEAIFIVKPDLKEEELKNTLKVITDLVVKNGGTIKKDENWGKRQTAYPVNKNRDGYYYRLDFVAPSDAIAKLDAAFKLNAEIVRVMVTRR